MIKHIVIVHNSIMYEPSTVKMRHKPEIWIFNSWPSQIELKEPFWLPRSSHCSVINLAHVGEPFTGHLGVTRASPILCGYSSRQSHNGCTHVPKGAVEGAEGAICLNGFPGSLKSSFSFPCAPLTVAYTYTWFWWWITIEITCMMIGEINDIF